MLVEVIAMTETTSHVLMQRFFCITSPACYACLLAAAFLPAQLLQQLWQHTAASILA
jgi:hypothetical protein